MTGQFEKPFDRVLFVAPPDPIKTNEAEGIQGDPMDLHHPELLQQAADLKLQVEQAEIRARDARQAGDLTEFDNQRRLADALRAQWQQRHAEVQQLEIVAPCAGVVWQRREAAIGAWLRARMPGLLRERLEQRATEQ